jgi:hypothetical protein
MAPVWVTHVVLRTDRTISILSVMYRTRSTPRTVSVKLGMSFVLLLRITVFCAKKKLHFVVLLYRHYESRQLFGVAYVTACHKDLFRFKTGERNLFFSKVSGPFLGTSHPLIQCVKGALSLRVK